MNNENLNKVAISNEQATTQHEIMSFSEASILTDTIAQKTVVPPHVEDPYEQQTLVDFLQRTYNIVTQKWASSDDVSKRLVNIQVPNVLFAEPYIKKKLANFKYIRSGVRFGVRVNGTKFHYGKIIACWKPSHHDAELDVENENVYHASCYPHVVISATENEVHEFVVPYCLPWKYLDLDQVARSMGNFQIYVLNPLKVGEKVPDVSISVFMNLENVELVGMTTEDYFPVTYKAQGSIQEARAKSGRGVVSGVAEGLSTIAGSLKSVPIVGSSMGLVESVANTIGSVAKTLGFCKPNDISNYAPRILRNWWMAPSHGLENAPMLALDPENRVVADYSLVGSHPQEMSLAHLFSTPSLYSVISWDGTVKEIQKFKVSPTLCYSATKKMGDVDGTVYYPTVLSWASAPFEYWRGSLKFCVQVTCSAFHSGRLRISWDPDPIATVTDEDTNHNEAANRVNHIMDIQTETDYYFTIPYLRDLAWLRNVRDENTAMNGVVVIDVINPLTHPETPVPAVYINVWVMAGDDFQVAFPTELNIQDTKLYITPPTPPPIRAQGLTREQMRTQTFSPLVQPAKFLIDDHITMGEIVAHVKDLIARPSLYEVIDAVQPVGERRVVSGVEINIPNFPALTGASYPNYLIHYSRLFRYVRGSVVHKAVIKPYSRQIVNGDALSGCGVGNVVYAEMQSNVSGVRYITRGTLEYKKQTEFLFTFNQGKTIVLPPNSYNLEGVVPFYSPIYCAINTYSEDTNNTQRLPNAVIKIEYERYEVPKDADYMEALSHHYLSAGDDYILGFQVGPPAIFIPKTTTIKAQGYIIEDKKCDEVQLYNFDLPNLHPSADARWIYPANPTMRISQDFKIVAIRNDVGNWIEHSFSDYFHAINPLGHWYDNIQVWNRTINGKITDRIFTSADGTYIMIDNINYNTNYQRLLADDCIGYTCDFDYSRPLPTPREYYTWKCLGPTVVRNGNLVEPCYRTNQPAMVGTPARNFGEDKGLGFIWDYLEDQVWPFEQFFHRTPTQDPRSMNREQKNIVERVAYARFEETDSNKENVLCGIILVASNSMTDLGMNFKIHWYYDPILSMIKLYANGYYTHYSGDSGLVLNDVFKEWTDYMSNIYLSMDEQPVLCDYVAHDRPCLYNYEIENPCSC